MRFLCCLPLVPLGVIVWMVTSWKSYETIFDLTKMEVRSSGGRIGPRVYDVQPLTPNLLIMILPDEDSVIIQLPNLCTWTLFKWYYRGRRWRPILHSTPMPMPFKARYEAERIVDWLNQHGLQTRLEISSKHPVEEM